MIMQILYKGEELVLNEKETTVLADAIRSYFLDLEKMGSTWQEDRDILKKIMKVTGEPL